MTVAPPCRLPDWEARLHAFLDATAGAHHAFGRHDCALFAAGAVLAQTGHDFAAPFRRRYRTAAGAVRALRLYGAGDLVATFSAALGEPVHPALAGRGDIAFDGVAVGVIIGGAARFVIEDPEPGCPRYCDVRRDAWHLAWRIAPPGTSHG